MNEVTKVALFHARMMSKRLDQWVAALQLATTTDDSTSAGHALTRLFESKKYFDATLPEYAEPEPRDKDLKSEDANPLNPEPIIPTTREQGEGAPGFWAEDARKLYQPPSWDGLSYLSQQNQNFMTPKDGVEFRNFVSHIALVVDGVEVWRMSKPDDVLLSHLAPFIVTIKVLAERRTHLTEEVERYQVQNEELRTALENLQVAAWRVLDEYHSRQGSE